MLKYNELKLCRSFQKCTEYYGEDIDQLNKTFLTNRLKKAKYFYIVQFDQGIKIGITGGGNSNRLDVYFKPWCKNIKKVYVIENSRLFTCFKQTEKILKKEFSGITERYSSEFFYGMTISNYTIDYIKNILISVIEDKNTNNIPYDNKFTK